jgi:hypothetical protein
LTPVYADIWLYRADPLAALNHAIEEALDDATVPKTAMGKVAEVTTLSRIRYSSTISRAKESEGWREPKTRVKNEALRSRASSMPVIPELTEIR